MAQDFTTTALLASIKRRGMFPSNTDTFSTTDFLAIATEELQNNIFDLLISVRHEEYGVADYDQTVVAGTATYAMPARAAGDKLRAVQIAGSDGLYRPLQRFEPEQVHQYGASGSVEGYVFQDNSVILVPTPAAAGDTLRQKYYRRPNALVLPAAVATISSIDAGRTVITTTATIPATFAASLRMDIIDNNPGFRTLVMDALTTNTTSGTLISVTAALPASVTAGDYVCLAGESPVVQAPVELHPLLAQRSVAKILEALGDAKAKIAKDACAEMRAEAITFLGPRSDGSPKYIINRNGPGFGRGRRGRR